MQKFLIISGVLAFLALYALTVSTNSHHAFAEYFWYIGLFCGVLVVGLFGAIIRYIWQMLRDKHNNLLGSPIARRLSLMFTLVVVVPALALFSVSAQFISHSIQSWFGNDTKEALERSLSLSKSALDLAVDNSVGKAKAVQADVSRVLADKQALWLVLNGIHANKFDQMAVWDINHARVLVERNAQYLVQPELDEPTANELLRKGLVKSPENLNNKFYAKAWLLLPDGGGQKYALFFRQAIPEQVAKDVELIESARSKYAELVFAQQGLQTFFLFTLVMATVLAVLLALATALYFAQSFVAPILSLADGARTIAQGDFSHRITTQRKDELGKLSALFNHMTEQLAIAKIADEQHRIKQEHARQFLEKVLDSLSAGVITLDEKFCLNTYNCRASQILDVSLQELIGQHWQDWQHQSPQHSILSETFGALLATQTDGVAHQIAYTAPDDSRILLGKAVPLPDENGVVLVFDDITALVRAQKEAAWGEVAKRLAHEIRNPLTPIQLSAERLAWKLQDKLNDSDAKILIKSTDTIVKQVMALKEMVEAFRNYARSPAMKAEPINLNQLIEEVLLLYESNPCTFTAELSKIPLLLKADTTAMRQVLHNLFKNASEAAESAVEPMVNIRSERLDEHIVLTISNNGQSFSKEMLQSAFEPYKTDKPTGTGLGLSVVKKIIDEHGGRVSLANQATGGAIIQIILPSIEPNVEKNA